MYIISTELRWFLLIGLHPYCVDFYVWLARTHKQNGGFCYEPGLRERQIIFFLHCRIKSSLKTWILLAIVKAMCGLQNTACLEHIGSLLIKNTCFFFFYRETYIKLHLGIDALRSLLNFCFASSLLFLLSQFWVKLRLKKLIIKENRAIVKVCLLLNKYQDHQFLFQNSAFLNASARTHQGKFEGKSPVIYFDWVTLKN